MFRDISHLSGRDMVSITVDGVPLSVPVGFTVAAALLASGRKVNRSSPVSGQQRGPYCMMGVCYECLVEVDGIPNRQGCMTEVYEGMEICYQQRYGEVGVIEVVQGDEDES